MRCETLRKKLHAEVPTFPLTLKTMTQDGRSNVRQLNLDRSKLPMNVTVIYRNKQEHRLLFF